MGRGFICAWITSPATMHRIMAIHPSRHRHRPPAEGRTKPEADNNSSAYLSVRFAFRKAPRTGRSACLFSWPLRDRMVIHELFQPVRHGLVFFGQDLDGFAVYGVVKIVSLGTQLLGSIPVALRATRITPHGTNTVTVLKNAWGPAGVPAPRRGRDLPCEAEGAPIRRRAILDRRSCPNFLPALRKPPPS